MSRDPVSAIADWRGPDGTNGDTAVCACQVIIPPSNSKQRTQIYLLRDLTEMD